MLSHFRHTALFLVWGALLGTARHAQAADPWPVPRGPAREPVPYRYEPQVWQKVPKEFREDASAVILYSGTTHRIEDDGTVETTTHEVTRLNGRKGIESLGEYRSISFDPNYQKLTLNEARVLKAKGAVVPIEPKHVQLRDMATDYQIYDQDKQLVISFPNLEVGDTYEVKWTVRGKNPEFGGKYFARYTFGDDTYPVVRDELHVVTSPKQIFKYAALNGAVELKVSDSPREKHYYWKVANRAELPRDEDRPSKEELRLAGGLLDLRELGRSRPVEAEIAGGLLEMHAGGTGNDCRGDARSDDAPGKSTHADLLGAPAHSLCLARARRRRLHAPLASPGTQQPLRRLQGPGSTAGGHAPRDWPVPIPGDPGYTR